MDELFVKQSRADSAPLSSTSLTASFRYWIPLLAYAVAIVYLSSLSNPARFLPGPLFPHADKVVHALEYGVLAILCYRAFRYAGSPWMSRYPVVLAILAAAGFGLTDELHQWFVPFRQPSGWDLLADSFGAGLAAGGWHVVFGTVGPGEK